MNYQQLKWIEGEFVVHRFSAETPIPPTLLAQPFVTISRTADELSIVAPATIDIDSPQSDRHWVMFMFVGVLDFSLTGILAGIAQPLAAANVSIFAISTFDTDYVMVKASEKAMAEAALTAVGYQFESSV